MVSKIITPDMYPMIGIALLVAVALIILIKVIKALVRIAVVAGLLLLACLFVTGSFGTNGHFSFDNVGPFLNQVVKNVSDFGKTAHSALPSSTGVTSQTAVDPTPYMDVQSTYQNIVDKLKGVQNTAAGK